MSGIFYGFAAFARDGWKGEWWPRQDRRRIAGADMVRFALLQIIVIILIGAGMACFATISAFIIKFYVQ